MRLKSVRAKILNAYASVPSFVGNRNTWALREILWPRVKLSCVVRERGGARFFLSGDPLDPLILADMYGRYQALYFPAGLDDCPEGATILDVGAHHGYYTVAILNRLPRARAISVEPVPEACTLIRKNLRINGLEDRCTIHECAVSDGSGEALLEFGTDGSWGNRLTSIPSGQPVASVKTKTLSEILGSECPFLVKCNAEGGEFAVVPQLWSVEMRPAWLILCLHSDAGDVDDLTRGVVSHGYSVSEVLSTPGQPRLVCRLNAA